jgi:hypothetical protein
MGDILAIGPQRQGAERLTVRVSPEMVSRNATLQLMLNGQPLGTLPLGADGEPSPATNHECHAGTAGYRHR